MNVVTIKAIMKKKGEQSSATQSNCRNWKKKVKRGAKHQYISKETSRIQLGNGRRHPSIHKTSQRPCMHITTSKTRFA
jgi:murein L,D-transpeptidase YafK